MNGPRPEKNRRRGMTLLELIEICEDLGVSKDIMFWVDTDNTDPENLVFKDIKQVVCDGYGVNISIELLSNLETSSLFNEIILSYWKVDPNNNNTLIIKLADTSKEYLDDLLELIKLSYNIHQINNKEKRCVEQLNLYNDKLENAKVELEDTQNKLKEVKERKDTLASELHERIKRGGFLK